MVNETRQGVTYNTFCLKKESIMAGSGNDLPEAFDVIVIGTGLEESMVAAAASRIGHTVLHLDPRDYYGGDWAAFTLDGLQQWIEEHQQNSLDPRTSESTKVELKEGEELIELVTDSSVESASSQWHIKDDPSEEESKEEKNDVATEEESNLSGLAGEADQDSVATQVPTLPAVSKSNRRWPKHKVETSSRRFNLDLIPRLLYSRGAMVELLISSNISRYVEFKACSRVLTVKGGKLEHVPSSRADVFATKHVSVVEKRILMKFITFCVDYQSHPQIYEKFKDKTYLEFLKHEKLTSNLIDFVMTSIAMVHAGATCLSGLEATQKFLTSIGRFGNTPFLWSMYGSGELPQAFCRLAAVFGATYFLGRPLDGVVVDAEGTAVGVAFNGKKISCKHLVADSRLFPHNRKHVKKQWKISRKICLLEDSVMPTEKEQLTFVSLPPVNAKEGHYTFVKEVGFGTAACPKGMYVLHLTSRCDGDVDDVATLDEKRILDEPDRLIWSASFANRVEEAEPVHGNNIHFCSGPGFELDYDDAIGNARRVFADMFGTDAEFLPRAPDPEEIVIGGADEQPTNPDEATSSGQSDPKNEPDKVESNSESANEDKGAVDPVEGASGSETKCESEESAEKDA